MLICRFVLIGRFVPFVHSTRPASRAPTALSSQRAVVLVVSGVAIREAPAPWIQQQFKIMCRSFLLTILQVSQGFLAIGEPTALSSHRVVVLFGTWRSNYVEASRQRGNPNSVETLSRIYVFVSQTKRMNQFMLFQTHTDKKMNQFIFFQTHPDEKMNQFIFFQT